MIEPRGLIEGLGRLLEDAHRLARPDFSGMGVVVTADPSRLPILPLRDVRAAFVGQATAELLAEIASEAHLLHDGFHILSPELDLLAVSQYFSPPIVAGVAIDKSRPIGGRFVAALFGSFLADAIATGVVGRGAGLSVFERGEEVLTGQLR